MSNVTNGQYSVGQWSRRRPGSPEPDSHKVVDEKGENWILTEAMDPQYYQEGADIAQCWDDHDPCWTTDAKHAHYQVTIGHQGRTPFLTSLRIEPPEGVKINSSFLARVNASQLAQVADQWLREKDQPQEGSGVLFEIFRDGVYVYGYEPDYEELAAEYKAADSKTEFALAMAKETGRSKATVDRWIRKARDLGHLDEATTGRPPKDKNRERSE